MLTPISKRGTIYIFLTENRREYQELDNPETRAPWGTICRPKTKQNKTKSTTEKTKTTNNMDPTKQSGMDARVHEGYSVLLSYVTHRIVR